MPLNPWIARLALIAYLAGGWFFPALHDHCTAPSSVPAAVESSCSACTHCAAQRESKTTTERTAGQQSESVNGVEVHQCGGLCSLCVARTMTSSPIGPEGDFWSTPSVDQPRWFNIFVDLEPLLHNHSARGPPCSV